MEQTLLLNKDTHHLNYPFLLITHLVCADGQIHIEETRFLDTLVKNLDINEETNEEMRKILSQDDDSIILEDTLRAVPIATREETLRLLMFMTYVDGFCDPTEREFLEKVLNVWRIPVKRLDQLCAEAEAEVFKQKQLKDGEAQEEIKLSFGAKILKGIDSILSREVVDTLAKIAPKDIKETAQRLRREVILAGPEYDKAINLCAQVSKEDIVFTEDSLERVREILLDIISRVGENIKHIERKTNQGGAKSAKEVITKLKEDKENLEEKVFRNLEIVRETLYKKRRAMNYFTLSFMGKTKAGKSTLHAIVTGEGWDAIGVGKQRTTRYNRVYEWKNIRIIDTPGIGASEIGGRSDEEIAKSIIDETDVMCFVLTNNNQQETEFRFLKLLKDKAKPLIILLNVQENLQNQVRLKRFIENPNKLFSEDKKQLGGHIDHIRSYAREFYGNDYFHIVPVQLLAAQISRQIEDEKQKEALHKASRIQDFLDTIRVSLINDGVIRRSQTLLGCTVGDIDLPKQWAKNQAEGYLKFAENLRERSNKTLKSINKEGNEAINILENSLEEIFQELRDYAQDFAEDYWDADEDMLNRAWRNCIEGKKIDERIQLAYKKATGDYGDNIKSILEEMGREMELSAKLDGFAFALSAQDSSTTLKNTFKWGGMLIALAGAILVIPGLNIIAVEIAGIVGLIGAVISWVSGWFTSREEKRRKAVEKISSTLTEQIDSQKTKVIKNYLEEFIKQQSLLKEEVKGYFDCLINGLSSIGVEMKNAYDQIDKISNKLNRAYAKRVVDWCEGKIEPLNEENITSVVTKVTRELGRSMEIYLKRNLIFNKPPKEIENVLQEKVKFNFMKGRKS